MPNKSINGIFTAILALSLVGFIDSIYLTAEHFLHRIPSCSFFEGCGTVIQSQYSSFGPIPTALLGAVFYLSVFLITLVYRELGEHKLLEKLVVLTSIGFGFTIWLIALQAFVINAFCVYCLLSAGTSTTIFILSLIAIKRSRRRENL